VPDVEPADVSGSADGVCGQRAHHGQGEDHPEAVPRVRDCGGGQVPQCRQTGLEDHQKSENLTSFFVFLLLFNSY
jgi:hypothetical protein